MTVLQLAIILSWTVCVAGFALYAASVAREITYVTLADGRKTGEAFALAAQLGALAAGVDDAPYRRYALTYGVLFQIRDDLADGADSPELLALQAEYEALLAKDPVAARI